LQALGFINTALKVRVAVKVSGVSCLIKAFEIQSWLLSS
jgi:hypothetical protein